MAAPNLINANTIVGKTSTSNLTSTAVRTVLDNPANSGKVLKVNTLNLCNYNTSAVTVTVFYSNSTLNIIDKTSQYYLEENNSFGAAANTANCISVSVSYEDIS
jgi:hypothetical protein